MFDKKVIFTVAGIVAAGVAFLGYAVYKNYPDETDSAKIEGADAK